MNTVVDQNYAASNNVEFLNSLIANDFPVHQITFKVGVLYYASQKLKPSKIMQLN